MKMNKTPDQICRIDAQHCFVEFMSSLFEPATKGKEAKMVINFVAYGNDNKTICSIPIYVDIPKFLVLTDAIRFGTMKQKANAELQAVQQGTKKYPEAIWRDMGGTSAALLARLGKSRPNQKAESRIMEIVPSSRYIGSYMIKAVRGDGEEQQNGLIAPKIDYKNKKSYDLIAVLATEEDLKGMAKLVEMAYQGYVTSQWLAGSYSRLGNEPGPQAPAPTPQPTNNTNYNQPNNVTQTSQPVQQNVQPTQAQTQTRTQAPVAQNFAQQVSAYNNSVQNQKQYQTQEEFNQAITTAQLIGDNGLFPFPVERVS